MKRIKKHSVKSCAKNKISQFSSVKILNKMQNLLNILKLIQSGIISLKDTLLSLLLLKYVADRRTHFDN